MNHRESQPKPPEEKKSDILRIAAEEFTLCGYSGASTNTITKRAGISKGILFHYYGSKKELFLLILNDTVKRLVEYPVEESTLPAGSSLYDHMAALFLSKTAFFIAYPNDIALLERAQQEQSADVRPQIVEALVGLAAVMKQRRRDAALRAIDEAKLRAGIPKQDALECIMMALEALDMHFYAQYRGRGAEVMTKPERMLGSIKRFLDVVSRGLFED